MGSIPASRSLACSRGMEEIASRRLFFEVSKAFRPISLSYDDISGKFTLLRKAPPALQCVTALFPCSEGATWRAKGDDGRESELVSGRSSISRREREDGNGAHFHLPPLSGLSARSSRRTFSGTPWLSPTGLRDCSRGLRRLQGASRRCAPLCRSLPPLGRAGPSLRGLASLVVPQSRGDSTSHVSMREDPE